MSDEKLITRRQLLEMAGRVDKEIDEDISAAIRQAIESGLFNGVGIASIVQTTTSDEDGGSNVITVTLDNGAKSSFTVKNGSKGGTGATGAAGAAGTNATINGETALEVKAGAGITATMSGSTLTLAAKGETEASFTLTAANWTSGSGITAYPYKYALTVSGVTANTRVKAVLDPASEALAAECGMCAANNSSTNTVTFYSRAAPASALTGTLYYH